MWRLSVFALIATASAQIPSLGWCPDFQPMPNFNMNRFLGTWYEAERYFTVSELGTRCVTTNYGSTPEGRILVSNEITNSLTGYKRVMEGHLQMIGREGEGRMMVKYSSLPLPYDSEYSVLETDYDNYAVIWSCSGIGPVHTQNTWLMTRDRLASSMVMQSAYAVLDKFKISRAFFVKTNQADCTIFPDPVAEPVAVEAKSSDIEMDKKLAAIIAEREGMIDKRTDIEAKPSEPVDKSATLEPAKTPSKPMPVPELIKSESGQKKDEKMDKPEEPAKGDMSRVMEPEKSPK